MIKNKLEEVAKIKKFAKLALVKSLNRLSLKFPVSFNHLLCFYYEIHKY